MNKILSIIASILLVVYIISFFKMETNFLVKEDSIQEEQSEPLIKESKTIKVFKNDEYIDIYFEEYIIGVVAGEMPALYSEEALKAQAIASRTYAYNYLDKTIKATKDNQVYNSLEEMKNKWKENFDDFYNRIKQAVEETKGLIMTYNNKPIKAYFYSESNGYTERCENVFSETLDYYDIVESKWDGTNPKTVEITKEDFCNKLEITCDEIKIEDIEYDDSKRVSSIKINDKIFKGTEIRKLLNLRSTDFKIEINDTVSITTKGYGHGVGMSQHGANEMAKLGYRYDEILKYYYKNIEITKI